VGFHSPGIVSFRQIPIHPDLLCLLPRFRAAAQNVVDGDDENGVSSTQHVVIGPSTL
jgi:hypothetical protein